MPDDESRAGSLRGPVGAVGPSTRGDGV